MKSGMFTTRPEIKGTFGVAASTHWLASATAMSILERGGNAFDAAAAGGFVLQVVEPHLNGPGGEVPIILHNAATRRTRVICGQGTAPAAANIDHFKSLDLDLVPGTGLLPAVVPGAFDAWLLMLRDYGTMTLADVFAPAIDYARRGYPLVSQITNALSSVRSLFDSEWPTSKAVYLSDGSVPKTGDLFRNPKLAETYERIISEVSGISGRERQIEKAREVWYKGFVAEAIDRFYAKEELMDSSGRRNKGLLTGQDMADWHVTEEDPVTLDYHGHTIAKCGYWSQGPVMLQTLALLKSFDIDKMAPDGVDFAHTVVEAVKLAFADREAWYGDSHDEGPSVADLLDDSYSRQRAELIGVKASLDLRPGMPLGREPRLPNYQIGDPNGTDINTILGVGEPTVARQGLGEPTVAKDGDPVTDMRGALRGDTCHIDVVDRWGNMVAATPSGGWFQSSPVIPELGFSLTTRAQMFWLDKGLPSSLRPGRRPRTTLTPSLALRDGKPYMAWGTPGGDQQDQWSLIFLLRHIHHGLNLQEAIDAPSFHSEHWASSFWPRQARPNRVLLEGRYSDEIVNELRRRGHDVEKGGDWSEGRLSACSREDHGDTLYLRAGANARGMQGYAAGR